MSDSLVSIVEPRTVCAEGMAQAAQAAAPPIRVLVVDRPGWVYHASAAVAGDGNVTIVGRAFDADAAIRLAAEAIPDVLIVNLPWDADAALDVIRRLRRGAPNARVIAFAAHATGKFIRAAFDAGASALLFKDDDVEILAEVLRQSNCGEPYYSPSWRNLLLSNGEQDTDAFDSRVLTPREWDVIALIAESLNSGQIAKTLGIETTTVQAHRANIMKKLGIHKVTGLVRWYEQHKQRREAHVRAGAGTQ